MPDEVRIYPAGRRPLYGSSIHSIVIPEQHVIPPVGRSKDIRIVHINFYAKLWVRRGPTWVPTVTTGMGRFNYLHMTNLSDTEVFLDHGPALG